jgi:hypothetical protein
MQRTQGDVRMGDCPLPMIQGLSQMGEALQSVGEPRSEVHLEWSLFKAHPYQQQAGIIFLGPRLKQEGLLCC